MQSILHPVSGENGFFITPQEKDFIDVVLSDFKNRHLVVTSPSVRGVLDE